MDAKTQAQASEILRAVRRAYGDLRGPGPTDKRAAAARSHFAAYTHDGPLSPHVRDIYFGGGGVRAVEAGLARLESLARAFAKPEAGGE